MQKNANDTKKIELIRELKKVSNDEEFIIGVSSRLKTDIERKTMLDFLKNGENVTEESVILFELEISEYRRK